MNMLLKHFISLRIIHVKIFLLLDREYFCFPGFRFGNNSLKDQIEMRNGLCKYDFNLLYRFKYDVIFAEVFILFLTCT